ncbi:hypothetical protein [Streptomyces sp. NPDC059708]|uniref:hypothetical protein n=1 Tax=Streptomyces sp. NPDC059708 TaxID=3346916 RepID=UPI00368D151E
MTFSEWAILRRRELGLDAEDPDFVYAYTTMQAALDAGEAPDSALLGWAIALQVSEQEVRRRALVG